jgi:hypothetical protein
MREPGHWVLRVASLVCGHRFFESVVVPVVADLQHEHGAASTRRQRFVARLRGYWALLAGAGLYALHLPGRRWRESWASPEAPGPRLVRDSILAIVVTSFLLALPSALRPPGRVSPFPHLPVSILPLALAIGVALTLAKTGDARSRRPAARAATDLAVVVALILSVYRATLLEVTGLASAAGLIARPALAVSLTWAGLAMIGRVRRWMLPLGLLLVLMGGSATVPFAWNSLGWTGRGIPGAAALWSAHAVPWLVILVLAVTRGSADREDAARPT